MMEVDQSVEPYEQLKRHWLNEQNAPEILPYQREAVEDLLELVENQQQLLLEADDADKQFLANLYTMEINRIQYLLQCYLRCRLMKIEQHCLHILTMPTMTARLSSSELEFAQGYKTLLNEHFNAAFLNDLPEPLRKIDDNKDGVNMVREPNLDQHVLCVVDENIGNFSVDKDRDSTVPLSKGQIFASRYCNISGLLLANRVHLV
jgi:hypothetical protein